MSDLGGLWKHQSNPACTKETCVQWVFERGEQHYTKVINQSFNIQHKQAVKPVPWSWHYSTHHLGVSMITQRNIPTFSAHKQSSPYLDVSMTTRNNTTRTHSTNKWFNPYLDVGMTTQHKHTAQTNGSTHTLMLAWQHNKTYQHSAQTSGPTPTLMLAWQHNTTCQHSAQTSGPTPTLTLASQHNTTCQHSAQTSGPTPTLMLAWLTAAPCRARKMPAAWLTLFAARCSRLLPAHHSTSLSKNW